MESNTIVNGVMDKRENCVHLCIGEDEIDVHGFYFSLRHDTIATVQSPLDSRTFETIGLVTLLSFGFLHSNRTGLRSVNVK